MNRYGTVGEARALFADCRTYSTRDQNKFFWMLFNSLSGPIDYSRFKRIHYFEEEPTNSLERRFAEELRAYESWLDDPSLLLKGAGLPSPDEKRDLYGVMGEALEYTKRLFGDDELRFYLCLNVVLLDMGLFPLRFFEKDLRRIHGGEDLASVLCEAMLSMKHIPKGPEPDWGSLSLGEISKKIGRVAKRFPICCVYVFGSFAVGEALPSSDLDLAVLFERGLARREKSVFLERFKVEATKAVGRPCDVHETLTGNPADLKSFFGKYEEVFTL